MFRNYVKIAVRNAFRYKGYSLINIFGLATGICAFILILLYVQDELSYDQFHTNKERIYRVTRNWFNSDGTVSLHLARVAPPIGMLLKNDFPAGIEKMVRIRSDFNTLLKVGDRTFVEDHFRWAGEEFFDIFSFPLLRGDPAQVLREPNMVVLTRSTADKLFGSIDAAIGKVINYENSRDLLVTGVVEDVPENSHIKFDYLGSMRTLIDMWGTDFFATNWGRNNFGTYLLLSDNFPVERLRDQIPDFLDRHLTQLSMDNRGRMPETRPSLTTMLHLQKLTDIHLHSHLNSEWEVNGDIKNIYLFTVIAFFILLIACINFMNLATARSARRAREIGMRKVLGAQRKQLILQFLGESLFISFIALISALILAEAVLPYFNQFVGKHLALDFLENSLLLPGLLIMLLVVGLLAGSYPALYLSRFRPLAVIKDQTSKGSSRSVFRTVLVVAQFAISIGLIICVGVVQSQVDFWLDKDLGYDREQIVILPSDRGIMERMESVKADLLGNTNIISVASSRLVPTNNLVNSWGGRRLDSGEPEQLQFRLAVHECDYDFIDTYGIKIIAGRNFSREYGTDDSAAFILNEAAIAKLGWGKPDQAVGKPLEYGGQTGHVIGVVENFNFESLRNEIVPIILLITHTANYRVSVRIRPEHVRETLQFLEAKWQQLRPDYPFEYHFLDDAYNNLYRAEIRLGEIFGVFSALAIFIACLGLLGLVAFIAEQKTKEIGIRKILGASVARIVLLLTGDFGRWILIANLIAWPVAWYGMNQWLQDFAYRIHIGLGIFAAAAVLALMIALITIAFQAVRAATANPVDALRYE